MRVPRIWRSASLRRAGIAFHWLIQPVIMIASDGRSASVHSYLFHPDTSKLPGSASLFGAMYPDNQFVLEDGVWRMWNLSLDEPYFALVGGWKGGWSGVAPPPRPPAATPPRLSQHRRPPHRRITSAPNWSRILRRTSPSPPWVYAKNTTAAVPASPGNGADPADVVGATRIPSAGGFPKTSCRLRSVRLRPGSEHGQTRISIAAGAAGSRLR